MECEWAALFWSTVSIPVTSESLCAKARTFVVINNFIPSIAWALQTVRWYINQSVHFPFITVSRGSSKTYFPPFLFILIKQWIGMNQFSSVAQSCPTLCDPMDQSMLGLPAHHQLPECTQTHVHWVSDAIQPSHPLSSPSPPALNLS